MVRHVATPAGARRFGLPIGAIIGFTGTQHGMTAAQKRAVDKLLKQAKPKEVHHGDAIGADTDFHGLARGHGYRVHIHPPTNSSKRGFNKGDAESKPRPYLDRNQDIVNASDVLIATPKGTNEELRSGTWATIRRARKAGKHVVIVNPDGSIKLDSKPKPPKPKKLKPYDSDNPQVSHAKGTWFSHSGHKYIRRSAYKILGYDMGESTAVDPTHFDQLKPDKRFPEAETDKYAVELLDELSKSGPVDYPLYRTAYLPAENVSGVVASLRNVEYIDVPLVSFSESRAAAREFNYVGVLFVLDPPVHAVRMSNPYWNESEILSGGRFIVKSVSGYKNRYIEVHLSQDGVFDSQGNLTKALKQRWEYDYLFDQSLFGSARKSISISGKTITLLEKAFMALFTPLDGAKSTLDGLTLPDGTEPRTLDDYAVLLGTTPQIAALYVKEVGLDLETKVRRVRDAEYWGKPVGTPIIPGMRPRAPRRHPSGPTRVRRQVWEGAKRQVARPVSRDEYHESVIARSGVPERAGGTPLNALTRMPNVGDRVETSYGVATVEHVYRNGVDLDVVDSVGRTHRISRNERGWWSLVSIGAGSTVIDPSGQWSDALIPLNEGLRSGTMTHEAAQRFVDNTNALHQAGVPEFELVGNEVQIVPPKPPVLIQGTHRAEPPRYQNPWGIDPDKPLPPYDYQLRADIFAWERDNNQLWWKWRLRNAGDLIPEDKRPKNWDKLTADEHTMLGIEYLQEQEGGRGNTLTALFGHRWSSVGLRYDTILERAQKAINKRFDKLKASVKSRKVKDVFKKPLKAPQRGTIPLAELDEDVVAAIVQAYEVDLGNGYHTVVDAGDSYTYNGEEIRVAGWIMKDNYRIGQFNRHIYVDRHLVDNAFLEIKQNYQGNGIAMAFYRNAEAVMKEQGIEKIAIHANIDVGGYAWARIGFDWAAPDDYDAVEMNRSFKGYLEYLIGEMAFQGYTRAQIAYIENILKVMEKRRLHPWEIAAVGEGVVTLPDVATAGGKQIPLWPGKKFLLGKDWNGIKDVGINPPHVTEIKAYLPDPYMDIAESKLAEFDAMWVPGDYINNSKNSDYNVMGVHLLVELPPLNIE